MYMISVKLGSARVVRRGAPESCHSKGLKPRQGSAGGGNLATSVALRGSGEEEELALEAKGIGVDQGLRGIDLSEPSDPQTPH